MERTAVAKDEPLAAAFAAELQLCNVYFGTVTLVVMYGIVLDAHSECAGVIGLRTHACADTHAVTVERQYTSTAATNRKPTVDALA
eukprot:15995-Heterococcus_DN1.PRE.1